MIKSVEKISKPSSSLSPKQMQKDRFGPRSFEPAEAEHEAPAGSGASSFSYNLVNVPAYPPIQRKEPEDEELQMMPSKSCPECEQEEIQAKSMDNGINPIAQRQQDPNLEEEEVLQGKFSPVQRTSEDEEEIQAKSMDSDLMPAVQRQADTDLEEEEVLQGKFLPVQRLIREGVEPLQSRFESNALKAGPVQDKPETNHTGMPDQLKAGIESLSGIDMSDVRVHSNSDKPAHLNALAYAQGNEIHLEPGQEKHLPHEVWHVVQQKQGRVKPSFLAKSVKINDNPELEHEADMMGNRALSITSSIMAQGKKILGFPSTLNRVVQREFFVPDVGEPHIHVDGYRIIFTSIGHRHKVLADGNGPYPNAIREVRAELSAIGNQRSRKLRNWIRNHVH